MASKYAHVLAHLPPLSQDPNYQTLVDAVKSQILTSSEQDISPAAAEKMGQAMLNEIEANSDALYQLLLHATHGKRYALSSFADVYVKLRYAEERIEAQLKNLRLLMMAYEQLLIAQMEVESVPQVKLNSGETVRADAQPHSIIEDPVKFRAWCVEAGLEGSFSLPWPTTNSLVKERLLEGLPEPEGVKVYVRSKIIFNRS